MVIGAEAEMFGGRGLGFWWSGPWFLDPKKQPATPRPDGVKGSEVADTAVANVIVGDERRLEGGIPWWDQVTAQHTSQDHMKHTDYNKVYQPIIPRPS